VSALTRNQSTQTVPNEITLKYYVQRAKGGAGLVISELSRRHPHFASRVLSSSHPCVT
ncbi:hypothetical protein DFH06DRAFT_996768, partial [Mycena polygramma]